MNVTWQTLRMLAPECWVIAAAFIVLCADAALWRAKPQAVRSHRAGCIAIAGCLFAIGWMAGNGLPPSGDLVVLTPLSQLVKGLVLGLAALAIALSLDVKFTRHCAEYFALLLFSVSGLMLLVSSDNFLLIFIALELAGLPLYVLTAFNKSSVRSAEAALKYFLFGGVSAAFTLFGISLCYGITGEVRLPAIAFRIAGNPNATVWVAVLMTLAGFTFKIAAAPFHFWAPDAYEGAPAPAASFIASASKVGAFFVVARILFEGFGQLHGSAAIGNGAAGWMPIVAMIAVASMVLGNLAAIVQTSVKRLLAYSSVAHAGYALLALFSSQPLAMSSLIFYVFSYAATVLGAFAVVAVLENSGSRDRLTDFCGLCRRAPLLSACMLVFMLSLAGVPPLAGFFGKFWVFTAAAGAAPNLGLLWLVILAVAASVVSLYYYLQVLKQIYAGDAPADAPAVPVPIPALAVIVGLAALVIALGCAPQWLLTKLAAAIQSTPLKL
jgi:NADH-quinone oxidoreductase subunit N